MLIWRLRQALNNPLADFEPTWRAHAAVTRGYAVREPVILPVIDALANLLRGVGLVVLPIGAILFGAPLLIIIMFVIFTASPILMPLAHLLYGSAIAYHISGSIAHEHEKGTYDQLSTLPPGSLGLHWKHATNWLTDHHRLRSLAVGMVLIGTATTLFGSVSLFGLSSRGASGLFYWVLSSASVIVLLVVDHFSTQVTAALLSMILPASTANATSARFGAVSLFVSLQIAAYLLGVITAVVVLPALYQLTEASEALVALTLPTITLLVFAGFREWLVRRLWFKLRLAVNATPAEMEALC